MGILAAVTPSRRAVLAGACALATGAAAGAPAARTWIDYQGRLDARLGDAGGGRFDEAMARALLARTNSVRAAQGAGPLAWHEELAATARAHAGDLAERAYVEHLSPEGFDPSDRLSLVSRRLLGSASENIAYYRDPAPPTPAELMKIWRGSPQHWGNLQRAHYTHAGFAVVRKARRAYAVGLFARPQGELAAPLPFRLTSQAELGLALAGVAQRFSLVALGPGADRDVRASLAGGGRTPPGVYQLFVQRAQAPEAVSGPVFAWRAEDVG